MQRTAKISQKIQEALNGQVRNELASAYEYLAMSAWLDTVPMPGAAAWMRVQANEELAHAMRFYDFIQDRSGRVDLHGLSQPTKAFNSVLEVFEKAYGNEQKVTADIMGLYELAMNEKDYASHAFLQGFLTEQIEEEKTALGIVDTLRMAGDEKSALFMVDRELGSRSSSD